MDIYQDSRCLALEEALYDEGVDPIDLPFMFLKVITNNFSDDRLIGRGGFGEVYKGILQNGMVVAVKKLLDKIDILEVNFESEVACLIVVKHKNIVRCLGYSSETQHVRVPYEGNFVWADLRQRLLCFEYLSKGSLADYLTGASSGLQWSVRYQIIKGICEGVGYLHQHNIIHMDLKPQNILLDDNMMSKIADFGLSRRLSENQSRIITTKIVGTPGYLAPEFLSSRAITFKADIYSLGVIIIEILMGHKEEYPDVDKVLESWTDMFRTLESHPLLEQVKVCAEIGIDCMNDNPRNRPTIQDIICRLDEKDISNSPVTSVPNMTSSSGEQFVDEAVLALNPCEEQVTMASSESTSVKFNSSPCGACELLRRRCRQKCLFAPYFPPEDRHKFVIVHKVFGASNAFKLLQELPADARADAVNSMVYEAKARMRDPVYGCMGAISCLLKQVSHLQTQLARVHAENLCVKMQHDGPPPSASQYLQPQQLHLDEHVEQHSVSPSPNPEGLQQPESSSPREPQLVITEPERARSSSLGVRRPRRPSTRFFGPSWSNS